MTIDQAIQHPVFNDIRMEYDFKFEPEMSLDLSLSSEMTME